MYWAKKYGIGSIENDNISINQNKLNMWKKRSPFRMTKCAKCKFILLCGGGCPLHSLVQHNDINQPVCNDIEKTMEIYVKHMKKAFLSR
jgi:uncharacterized protein